MAASGTLPTAQVLPQRGDNEVLHLAVLLDAEQANAPLEFARDTGVEVDEWLGRFSQLSLTAAGRHCSPEVLPGTAPQATRITAWSYATVT